MKSAGSVLVIVLWIGLGLVAITLYFAHSMSMELRAADNRVAGQSADQAIEGAARYVTYILTTYATNGAMPDPSLYRSEAVPIGDSRFWLIGRTTNSNTRETQVTFGLIDESSKLNLNTVTSNMLYWVPRMTTDLSQAIVDWRDTNGTGSTQMYYSMAKSPYRMKASPFESVEEIRLLYGADPLIVGGEDLNRNGILDGNEKDEDGDGKADGGLIDMFTVFSREPNMHSDGSSRTNVMDNASRLQLLQAKLGTSRGMEVNNLLGTTQIRSPLQFYVLSRMTPTEFGLVYGDLAFSTNTFTEGRVNINTASAAVIGCLPGMDVNTAQQVVDYRRSNPGSLTSPGWIVEALGANSAILQTLQAGDYVTTQTYQFTADIAAVGPFGRGYRRVKFIFDISDGTVRIVSRQDLSRLGWALGDKVRETLLAKDFR
ncbi:MAG TPA: type II secretion system protein GspK [Candidatus Limnocylindria bacterium]|jgi:DNA uptake protein ComE-like DNA-binding protein|nr:type II secretion system protein GspK [Candidatus Limnocylindria bacterium]